MFQVTDIRALQYKPSGEILYKLRFSEDWVYLPHRIDNNVIPKSIATLRQLHSNRLKITKRKYNDLQELKLTMPTDYHHYYDNIPHETNT